MHILKFIPSFYIKNLLEIVVKLKIKKCWPNIGNKCIPVVLYNVASYFISIVLQCNVVRVSVYRCVCFVKTKHVPNI